MHKPGSTQHPSELGTKPVAGPAAWLEPQCEGQRPGVQTQQPNADALSPSDRQTYHQLAISPLSCGLPLNAEGFNGSPKPGNASGLEPRPPRLGPVFCHLLGHPCGMGPCSPHGPASQPSPTQRDVGERRKGQEVPTVQMGPGHPHDILRGAVSLPIV